jgi:hypothetical protein
MNSNEQMREIMANVMVMLDVAARLLAYEARRHPDQRRFFEEFSAGTDARLRATLPKEVHAMDPTTIAFQEMTQRTMDNLLGRARRIAMANPEEKGP